MKNLRDDAHRILGDHDTLVIEFGVWMLAVIELLLFAAGTVGSIPVKLLLAPLMVTFGYPLTLFYLESLNRQEK